MTLSPQEWQERFRIQVGWSSGVRRFIFSSLELDPESKVLEVGCGPGALLESLAAEIDACFYGLDINYSFLELASQGVSGLQTLQGDGYTLPLMSGSFDVLVFHYLLLWITDPGKMVREMARVLREGGKLIALSEPDYGGRLDYPDELADLGKHQAASLINQGANPFIGRRIASIFADNGVSIQNAGIIGSEWTAGANSTARQSEWQVLQSDLEFTPNDGTGIHAMDMQSARELDASSRIDGTRVLFVPTFYVLGSK